MARRSAKGDAALVVLGAIVAAIYFIFYLVKGAILWMTENTDIVLSVVAIGILVFIAYIYYLVQREEKLRQIELLEEQKRKELEYLRQKELEDLRHTQMLEEQRRRALQQEELVRKQKLLVRFGSPYISEEKRS